MMKIKNTVGGMHTHRPIVWFQQIKCAERASKTSELFACFCKFVIFLVWNFIFNVSFEVCARTNRILRNGYLQTAYGLTSPPFPFLCVMVALYKYFKNRPTCVWYCFRYSNKLFLWSQYIFFVIVTAANNPPHTSAQVVISPQILSSELTRWNLCQQLIVTRIE